VSTGRRAERKGEPKKRKRTLPRPPSEEEKRKPGREGKNWALALLLKGVDHAKGGGRGEKGKKNASKVEKEKEGVWASYHGEKKRKENGPVAYKGGNSSFSFLGKGEKWGTFRPGGK